MLLNSHQLTNSIEVFKELIKLADSLSINDSDFENKINVIRERGIKAVEKIFGSDSELLSSIKIEYGWNIGGSFLGATEREQQEFNRKLESWKYFKMFENLS